MERRRMKSQMVLLMLAVVVLAAVSSCIPDPEGVFVDEGMLARMETEEYEVEMQLSIDGMQDVAVSIQVPPRRLTTESEQELLEKAVKELERIFVDKNLSLDHIEEKVGIQTAYQNGRVSAEWSFSKECLISENGDIREDAIEDESENVEARVLLRCEDSSLMHVFGFTVYKAPKSVEESWLEQIYAEIEEDGKIEGTAYLTLPKNVDGHMLSWKSPKSKTPVQVFFLGLIVVLLYPSLQEERKKAAKEKRELQLLHEFPEMVSKLALLIGAGMSPQTAWRRITERYCIARKEGNIPKQLVYEEMLLTQREIENGKGERSSYESFGVRCGLPRYRKLSNYLIQHLQKGGNGLLETLEKETIEVYAEQRNKVRRYGEEAETKLLFPMLLMLGIVIAIIMVPAIISFQTGI